jgi:hypothetical protein
MLKKDMSSIQMSTGRLEVVASDFADRFMDPRRTVFGNVTNDLKMTRVSQKREPAITITLQHSSNVSTSSELACTFSMLKATIRFLAQLQRIFVSNEPPVVHV